MVVTPTDIVNQAIQYYGGNQPPVTGSFPTFDDSAAGVVASYVYGPVIQTVMRQFGWDFSRTVATLALSGNTAPEPWLFEYLYPFDGIEIRQIMPAALTDPNNPITLNWTVGNVLVSSIPTKVIWSNDPADKVVYTNFPPPTLWDAGFREVAVRLLASVLAAGVAGKTDTVQKLLESAGSFESASEMRNG